ncbi:MAG: hypothetical protein QNJ81_01000 [Acidimicrobiia bacterium]|nr:hypothetical protein [Acidimicrobiia bacterium]
MSVVLPDAQHVRGLLPPVCAVTGEPATWYLRIRVTRHTRGTGYLLLLVPVVGWLVLLYRGGRFGTTTVEIPISDGVYRLLEQRAKRMSVLAVALAIGVVLSIVLASGPVWGATTVALSALGYWAASVGRIGVRATAAPSGEVTLTGLHPELEAAIPTFSPGMPLQ